MGKCYLNERWSSNVCPNNPRYAEYSSLHEAQEALVKEKKSLTEGFISGELIKDEPSLIRVMMTVNWVEYYITYE